MGPSFQVIEFIGKLIDETGSFGWGLFVPIVHADSWLLAAAELHALLLSFCAPIACFITIEPNKYILFLSDYSAA